MNYKKENKSEPQLCNPSINNKILKDNFISIINHEILTPINIIKGFSSIIKELNGLNKEEIYDYACHIENAAVELNTKFQMMLDLSLLESKQLPILKSSFTLHEVFFQLELSFHKKLKPSQNLHFHINQELLNKHIHCDRKIISNILHCLIDNAIKFTEEGQIDILAHKDINDPQKIHLTVRDEGTGFPLHLTSYLTDCFTQIDMSSSRSNAGLGLGLFYTQKMLAFLNGQLRISIVETGFEVGFILPNSVHKTK